MLKRIHSTLFLLVAGLALTACGGGSSRKPATFSVMFAAPGGSGFADGQIGGVPMAPAVTRDFTLAPGVGVTGVVTDGAGAPLANVDVSFRTSATAPEVDASTTDAAGSYSVTVAEGTWVAVLTSNTGSLGTTSLGGLLVAAPGPVTHDFQFAATVTVSGTVLDSLGAAVGAAQVELTGAQKAAQVTVVADAAGFYTASVVPDTYEAVVTPAGAAAATHLKQRFPGIVVGGALTRNFTLTRGVQVSGTVFTNVGLPLLQDTDIDASLPPGSNFFQPATVTTNPLDGTYVLGLLPPGSATFELNAPGDSGFPLQRFSRQIVGPANQTVDFTLALGVVLSGTVFRDDGVTPEPSVEIEPLPRNASLPPDNGDSDAAGRYEISLFPGTYDLVITPDPANLQLPERRVVTVFGPMTLDLALTRGALLGGTVTEPGGVTPAADIRVEIPNVDGASAVTDAAGAYSFLAPPGVHTLDLVAENGPFKDMALAPVPGVGVAVPGPVTQDITLALATTGRTVVQGTVFAPGGVAPVAGVDVEAMNALGDVLGRAVTDAAGAYTLVIP
ncbi:MAG: hypothetical protein ACE5JG_03085 [Planctomycetota bacterium]